MFEIFKPKIDTKDIYTLQQLKNKLLSEKKIHSKYRYKIINMDERELKNFVYTSEYTERNFEGVGFIFICIKDNNLKDLIKYILKLNLNAINILRLMVYCLNNIDSYEGRFKIFLQDFKNKYDKKFNALLFEIGQKNYIDMIDLIGMFRKLIEG
ncbi:MAG: hypothetical protein ABSG25_07100 [Bryobacteraceae bacterium]|jgi:hypothetical protein